MDRRKEALAQAINPKSELLLQQKTILVLYHLNAPSLTCQVLGHLAPGISSNKASAQFAVYLQQRPPHRPNSWDNYDAEGIIYNGRRNMLNKAFAALYRTGEITRVKLDGSPHRGGKFRKPSEDGKVYRILTDKGRQAAEELLEGPCKRKK